MRGLHWRLVFSSGPTACHRPRPLALLRQDPIGAVPILLRAGVDSLPPGGPHARAGYARTVVASPFLKNTHPPLASLLPDKTHSTAPTGRHRIVPGAETADAPLRPGEADGPPFDQCAGSLRTETGAYVYRLGGLFWQDGSYFVPHQARTVILDQTRARRLATSPCGVAAGREVLTARRPYAVRRGGGGRGRTVALTRGVLPERAITLPGHVAVRAVVETPGGKKTMQKKKKKRGKKTKSQDKRGEMPRGALAWAGRRASDAARVRAIARTRVVRGCRRKLPFLVLAHAPWLGTPSAHRDTGGGMGSGLCRPRAAPPFVSPRFVRIPRRIIELRRPESRRRTLHPSRDLGFA